MILFGRERKSDQHGSVFNPQLGIGDSFEDPVLSFP
jgi:hypothetical protein